MYMLNQIALVHWHGFTLCTHSFEGMTGILGANTAGKSTLIDAISLALGGASTQFVELNAAASDDKSKDRSIGGYILGQTSPKTIIRDAAVGYVALTFEHSLDPDKPRITIGFRASASRDAVLGGKGGDRTDAKELFIFLGPKLTAEDFCSFEGDEGEELTLHQLDDLVSERGGTLEAYVGGNQTTTYIRDCWRHLSSLRIINVDHARQWVKSMRRAMAFKASDNPGDFISEFLLEKKDIETAELTESIETYRKLYRDVASIKERSKALTPIMEQISTLDEYNRRLYEHDRAIPLLAYWNAKASAAWHEQRLELLEREREITRGEIESVKQDLDQIEEDFRELTDIKSSQSEAAQIEKLEVRAKRLEVDQRDALADLQDIFLAIEAARKAYRFSDRVAEYPSLYRSLKALAELHSKHPGPSWINQSEAVTRHFSACKSYHHTALEDITAGFADAKGRIDKLLKQKAQLVQEISDLDKGELTTPEGVSNFKNDLYSRGVEVTLVRDSVDVVMPEWQPSLEAILGGDREAVIVEPDDYERALEVLRSQIKRYGNTSLVNTVRLTSNPPKAARVGSLYDAVETHNPYVSSFLSLRLGQVTRANSTQELKRSKRGVLQTKTPEGVNVTFDDGVTVRNRRVPPFVLGSGAAELQLEERRLQLQTVETELVMAREDVQDLKTLMVALSDMQQGLEKTNDIQALVNRYSQISSERKEASDLVQRLIQKVNPELAQKFEELEREKRIAKENENEARGRFAVIEADIKSVKNILNSSDLGSRLNASNRLARAQSAMQGQGDNFAVWRLAFKLFREHKTLNVEHIYPKCASWEDKVPKQEAVRIKGLEGLERARSEIKEAFFELDSAIKIEISNYYRRFNIVEDGPVDMSVMFGDGGVAEYISEEHEFLTGTHLDEAENKLHRGSEQIQTIMQGTFLTELGSRLNEARTKVDRLTAALRDRPLHGERYRFITQYAPGTHEDLARLADAVCRDDGTGEPVDFPLFNDELLEDHPHRAALIELRQILDDPHEDFDTYKDYTNYLKFDLAYENLDTGEIIHYKDRKSSGSGAEKGVPWYVAIGASLAALYHGHNDRVSPILGFGPIIFDEAFAKLDGANQAILMDFFEGLGLQVILGAPDDRRITCMSYLHTIMYVSKSRNRSSAHVVAIHDYLREMLRNINPDMLTDEMLRYVCKAVDISDVDHKDKDALVGALLTVRDAAIAERDERLAMNIEEKGEDSFFEEAV
jgi:energy-coupling factor transporter ATP-binding protein EcfA2